MRYFDFTRFAAPSQPDKVETLLYPPFASVLQNEVQGTKLNAGGIATLTSSRIHPLYITAICSFARSKPLCIALRILQITHPTYINRRLLAI